MARPRPSKLVSRSIYFSLTFALCLSDKAMLINFTGNLSTTSWLPSQQGAQQKVVCVRDWGTFPTTPQSFPQVGVGLKFTLDRLVGEKNKVNDIYICHICMS